MAKKWYNKGLYPSSGHQIQVNVDVHIGETAFSGDELNERRQPVVTRLLRRFSRMGSDNEERQQQKTTIKGTTPLHKACCCGDLKCVKTLMQKDADVTIWDKRGFTPAHTAVYSNKLPCLKVLFDFIPPSLNLANEPSRDGETLLHISCMRGNLDMSRFLLKREANIDAVDHYGNSTLHYAASSDNNVLVRWLISKTKDWEMKINSKNQFGQTACHRACLLGNARSLSVLCQYNANLTVQDSSGCTALDLARIMGHEECYKIGCGDREPHPLPAPPPLHKSHPQWKKSSHADIPGVEVVARTTCYLTNSPTTFYWSECGFRLTVPPDSLPAGVDQCQLDIVASKAGDYQFPDSHDLVSGVFWVRPIVPQGDLDKSC